MSQLFLGLDSSTQSLTGLVIDLDARQVVHQADVNYGNALPQYGTSNGVLRGDDPQLVHAPPLMWLGALDLLFSRFRDQGVPLGEILAVSGSGQQHGSVYLNNLAEDALRDLDATQTLVEQLDAILSRATAPIWMDSSTNSECEQIENALGGTQAAAKATGSAAFERFTGPQIRKFFRQDPEAYAATSHIALVSSFMASVLTGRIAPIDHGDGAGMNLMDIERKTWHAEAVRTTSPSLEKKLPELANPWEDVGSLHPYFGKYGMKPSTRCIAWSGDNPNSVIGLGLIEPGDIAISLGTSDTFFGTMKRCQTDPRGEGHVFVSPTGDYMSLICFKNGSLARQRVRDAYGMTWDNFSQQLRHSPPGNGGKLMLPYFEPEIVPHVLKPGVRRFDLSEADEAGNCRAVVEAQMMSMRLHSAWMGQRPQRIHVTGGASTNREILQVAADVFQCPVSPFAVTNTAALGAALRAAHGLRMAKQGSADWARTVDGFVSPLADAAVEPRPETAAVYDALVDQYAAREQQILQTA